MKIGIDARMYGPQQTGIGTYIKNLTDALFRFDKKNKYVMFVRDQTSFAGYENVTFVRTPWRWYSLGEQTVLPLRFLREKLDLLFVPHFNAPVWYPGRLVVTIHDVTPLDFPARAIIPSRFRRAQFRFVASSAMARAAHIIAVSNFTKQQIIERFSVPQNKITVVHEAPHFAKVIPDPELLRRNFKLASPYLLYVGVLRPHKNILGLLEAFAKTISAHPELCLVLAGPEDPRYPEIRKRALRSDVREHVRMLGFVADAALPQLIANAKGVIVPSFVEGFGLVGLEALVQGVPPAVSQKGALPEVLGSAALYFNPYDHDDMARVMTSLLEGSQDCKNVLEHAPEVLSRYSWNAAAAATHAIFSSVLQ